MNRSFFVMTALVAMALGATVLVLHAQTTAPATNASTQLAIAPYEAESKERLNKSPRHGEWVEVPVAGGKPMRCYIVYPERADKAPVVLVSMEIFGMSDWVRATTDQLAADGFIAIAPDFLSGKGPKGGEVSPDEARGMVGKLQQDEVMTRLNAARDYGIKLPAANGKSATIGFCWGGGMSFSYATIQPDLNAAIVFYGTPPAEDQLAKIKCPVAGFYGGNDARITATVQGTTDAMKKLEKKYEPHVFDGAGHGFMRAHAPTDSAANQKAANAAWPLVVQFLKDSTK